MKIQKKSAKLNLTRDTLVALEGVTSGAGIPLTSVCTVSQGPLCDTLHCQTGTCWTCWTKCFVAG